MPKQFLRTVLCGSVVSTGALLAGWQGAQAQQQEIDAAPTRLNKAQPVSKPEPKSSVTIVAPAPAPAPDPFTFTMPTMGDGKWTFGGAIRARVDLNLDAKSPRTGLPETQSYFGFDTLILKAAYESSTLFGAARYRIYGGAYPYTRNNDYKGNFGEFQFLQFGYVGTHLSNEDSISVGVQQVPFGLLPYFSTTFFETIGFVMGVEEVYNTGIKYSHVEENLNYQLGYFPADGGNYIGISRDSARYSTNIVRADSGLRNGTNNAEQQMLVGRAEYTFYRTPDATATVGASVWHSSIYNDNTAQYGSKQQEAIHFVGTYGPWTLRALAARLDISPRNPGNANSLITVGGFDGSYNLATKGFFVSGEISYKIKPIIGPFSDVVPYINYSGFYKDRSDYKDSERYMIGAALTFRDIPNLEMATEFRFGRNDPYTGAGQFNQGLGPGGDNKWKTSYYTNIAYYF